MTRLIKMTKLAQQATWSKLSDNTNHIPTQFMVEGDAREGYEISFVNDDLCGFTAIKLRSFYATKRMIEDLNKTGYTDMEKYCSVGSFAWRSHTMPLILSNTMKVIDVPKGSILTAPY